MSADRTRRELAAAARLEAVPEEHAALARRKLGGPQRRAELERLMKLLEPSESVVTLAEALFKSATGQAAGLAVLTDRRLLCVDTNAREAAAMDFSVTGISRAPATVSDDSGTARRGELGLVCEGEPIRVLRIHPWERAEEIAAHLTRVPA